MNQRCRHDHGQLAAFFVVMLTIAVLMLGLVYEGGHALNQRSRALTLAQEAARAGAQQLDLAAYRAGADTTLAEDAAQHAAQRFLDQAGAGGTAQVEGDTVTVTAEQSHSYTLLPIGTHTLRGTASASPHTTTID